MWWSRSVLCFIFSTDRPQWQWAGPVNDDGRCGADMRSALMLLGGCVCPSADFISHTRSSPPSFRIFLRSGGGGGVLRYVSLFVYVNKRVCSSARWTRLKARRACSMSGDKHTPGVDMHAAFLVMHFIACNVLGLHTDVFQSNSNFGHKHSRVPSHR